MTSQINPNNIDGTYPVAGQPNNTQGFRDNFTNIKTNFQTAATEITDLENKGIFKAALTGTTLDNNMADNLIYAVKLNDTSYTYLQNTATAGSITLDYSASQYQYISTTGSVSLGFSNWPASGSAGVLNLSVNVTNTAYTLTLPASVSIGIKIIDGLSPGTPGVSNTITFAAVGTYVYTFSSSDGGTTVSIQNNIRPSNTYSNPIDITNTTPSTSTTTGALVVAGGVGIGANLNVAGNLKTYTSTGNVAFQSLDNGFVQLNTPTVAANTAGALNILGSNVYQNVTSAGCMIHITGNDGVSSRIVNDAYGTGAIPTFSTRAARGTASAPTAIQSGDVLARFGFTGWTGTAFGVPGGAGCAIESVATENFTDSSNGTNIKLFTSANGSNAKTLSMTVSTTATTIPGSLSATGNVVGGNVSTAGLVTATGNITGGNINTGGQLSVTGNITTPGNILLTDGGTMGYNSGSGGTVAQSGNKSGGVTLNKPSGEITMQNTALNAATTVQFTLTNSVIGAHDLLLLNIVGGVATGAAYNLDANCTTGSAVISVRNITAGSLSEAIVLRYAVIRGSIV